MYLRDSRGTAASLPHLPPGVLALVAGSFFLAGTALTVQHLNQNFFGQEVTVRLQPWGWATGLKIGFDQLTPETIASLPGMAGEAAVAHKNSEPAVLPVIKPSFNLHLVSRASTKLRRVATLRSVGTPVVLPRTEATQVETVIAVQSQFTSLAQTEHQKMESAYRGLRGRLFLALNSQAVSTQGVQLALRSEALGESVLAPAKVTTHPVKRVKRHASATRKNRSPARPAGGLIAESTGGQDQVHLSSAQTVSSEAKSYAQSLAPVDPDGLTHFERKVVEAAKKAGLSKPAITIAVHAAPSVEHSLPVATAAASESQEHSTRGARVLAGYQGTQGVVSTQSVEPLSLVLANEVSTQKALQKAPSRYYQEAFSKQALLVPVTTQKVTHEIPTLPNQLEAGWELVTSQDHWSTLYRHLGNSIPVISRNSMWLLAKLAGTPVQAETGVVFGKVPSGWSVNFGGRSERPIFLNASMQTISAHVFEGERFFVLLNAAPGAHPIYLAQGDGQARGAVGVPVMSGTATYLDLTWMSQQTVRGKLHQDEPLYETEVRALGNTAATSAVETNGSFRLERVLTVADYPVILESESKHGFTHRYQVSPGQLSQVRLFQMSPKQIQEWTDQLEGGVSPESGLILSAVPGVSEKFSTTPLRPVTRPLLPYATLAPESYTISPEGLLEPDAPIYPAAPRMLSVHVPEGPNSISLHDPKGKTVWSELVISSPNVVNVVGPY